MKNLTDQNKIIGLIEVELPTGVRNDFRDFGLVEGVDYEINGSTLSLISPKSKSIATRITVWLANRAELKKPTNLEVKFKWKEISYDGLIRDPSMYGPEWDQTHVNGWYGGYDTEEAAITAMSVFKAKYDLRFEYTLMKIYK